MAEYEGLSEENNRSGRQGSAQRLSCLLCSDSSADTTTPGCCDPTQVNYNPAATCDDGSCQPFTYGCTDPTATNYNATNTAADGSCIWLGCLNPTATNYMGLTSPYAGILPGPYNGGTEWGFAIDDGSCADGGDWHSGCTDPTALNYDASCLADPLCYSCFLNNCCTYPDPDVEGCTAPTADNYNSLANVDDGSCFIYLCTTPTATNWSGYSTNDPYVFPNGATGYVISDNTLCRFTTDPTNIDCTLQGAQIVAENIIWDTNRWLNGTLTSLQSWVENHWYYQPTGYIPPNSTPHPCKWFEKMVDKFTNQISDHFAGIPPHASWGPNLLAKKQAILEYFIEMQKVCDCVEDEPTVETECKTIIVDQNRYYRYEHDTDTTTPLIGVGAGSAPIHTIDQPYDVAMWSSKFYAVVEYYDSGAGTVDWIVKEYLVNWFNNEYSFVRDINVSNAINSLPQAYTMKDANTMLVMTQFGGLYPNQAIVAIDITTNVAPAGAVVVPWINFPNTIHNQGGDITCYDDDTMLVSFGDSDSIRHYYMDSAGTPAYAGAGPISNATVPNILGTVGHYIFDNDTYIITINNSSVNEVRQVTVPSFATGGPMVISPVLPNVIPSTQFIRGADTSCMDPDEGGDGLYNYRDCYNNQNTNVMFTAVNTPGSAGSGGAPHDLHRYTWREDVIGFDDFCITIADQDVLGNTYSPSDFDLGNNPNGFTITIYDNTKNFLGKWHYSGYGPPHASSPYTSAFYKSGNMNILTRDSAARVEYNSVTGVDDIVGVSFPQGEPGLPSGITLKLKGVTHLAGPNPLVRYGSNSDHYLNALNNNGVQLNNYEIDYELNTKFGFTSSYCFIKFECEATTSNSFENIFTGPNTATNNTAAICTGRWWNFEPSGSTGYGNTYGPPTSTVNLSSITVPSPALLYSNSNWTIEPGYPRLRPSPVSRYGGKVGVYLTGTYQSLYSPENAWHATLGNTNAYGVSNGWGWVGSAVSSPDHVSIQDIRNNWPYHYIHPWFASFQPSATLTNNGITWFPNVQTAISATTPGTDQPCITGTNALGASS